MRIEMSIKEWNFLMKHIDKNKLELVTTFEIGEMDENILGVKHLLYLSDDRLYGYNLKESAEKFYNVNEISDKKVSFDIKAEDLIRLKRKEERGIIIVKGYDTRYQNKQNAEIYATFENNEKSSAYRYLNKIKTSCLGNTCKFWIEEKEN